jgi:ssDNA-binding replication factor A large subunit
MKICELPETGPVDLIHLKVEAVDEPKTVKTGKLQTINVSDPTGEATLTLWGEQVGTVKEGMIATITKGWCKTYQGTPQISTGKFGALRAEKPVIIWI